MAVASAEPYASYLHFAPEDNHHSDFYGPYAIPDTQPTIKALKADVKHMKSYEPTMLYRINMATAKPQASQLKWAQLQSS